MNLNELFSKNFSLSHHDPAPTRKTIHQWVSHFRQISSALKRKSPGHPRTSTGSESVAAVTASIWQSPRRSLRKHASALHVLFKCPQNLTQISSHAPLQDNGRTRVKWEWLWNSGNFVSWYSPGQWFSTFFRPSPPPQSYFWLKLIDNCPPKNDNKYCNYDWSTLKSPPKIWFSPPVENHCSKPFPQHLF